ncbi:hypothetical protein PYW08_012620 [Mythimna loreyi]|uniref:Uncharacterized protein n=1 Tax=Mythimna loreyi TaxID=667449 RepID=A0ACC2Q342_9NEOP|nr:hypothetical protein PYW08_012620 [Mythimna loreyi]
MAHPNSPALMTMAGKCVVTTGMETGGARAAATAATTATGAVRDLLTMINKLSLEIAALREQGHRRNNFRGRGKRYGHSRSRSRGARSRMTPEDPNWLCKYHFRYRARATRCEKPCTWVEKKEN